MTKYSFAIIGILILFSACSTKFKVGADYKEVTIVYCLLSAADTAHYAKISKGYYDEEKNNLALAKIADSTNFANLQVEVQVINNNNVIETIPLTRVDLNNEGFIKEPGTFATSPNYAYKFKKALNAANVYKLNIVNPATGKVIEGQTVIINTTPGAFQFIKPSDESEVLDLTNTQFAYNFSWKGPSQAAFYDVVLRFKYQEVDINQPLDTAYIEKDVVLIQNQLANVGETNVNLSSLNFYKQLNSYVGSAPTNIKRYVDTPALKILAGGYELKTYIDVNDAQGGITFDQIKPNYTNFKGNDVYGIISTRGQIELPRIKFSGSTLDSILNSPFTNNLRFVGVSTK